MVVADGSVRGVKARVTKVSRALMSVYDMCASGHAVVFDLNGGKYASYVLHKESGRTFRPILRNTTWDLDVQVVPFSEMQWARDAMRAGGDQLASFQRQAASP